MDGAAKRRFLVEIGSRVAAMRKDIEDFLRNFLEFLDRLSRVLEKYLKFIDLAEKLEVFLRFYYSALLDKERGISVDIEDYYERIDEVFREIESLDIKKEISFLIKRLKEIDRKLDMFEKYAQIEKNLRRKLRILKKKGISFEEFRELEEILDIFNFLVKKMGGKFERSLEEGEEVLKEVYILYKGMSNEIYGLKGYKGLKSSELWRRLLDIEKKISEEKSRMRKIFIKMGEIFRRFSSKELLKKDPLGYGGLFKNILDEYASFSNNVKKIFERRIFLGKEKGIFWHSLSHFEEKIVSNMEIIRDYLRTFFSFSDRLKVREVNEETLSELRDLLVGLSKFEALDRIEELLKEINKYRRDITSLIWKAFEEMKHEINEDIFFFGNFVKEYREKRLDEKYLEFLKREIDIEVSNLELYYKDWMKRTKSCINAISKRVLKVEKIFEKEYKDVIEPFFISFEKMLKVLRKISLEIDILKRYIEKRLKKKVISERRIKTRLETFFRRIHTFLEEMDVVLLEVDGLNIFLPDIDNMDREILGKLEKERLGGYCGKYWEKYKMILGKYLERTKEILKEMYRKAIEITSLLSSLKTKLKSE